MSDPGTDYRTREEVQNTRETRDSISLLQSRLLDKGWISIEEIKAIEKSVRDQVEVDAEQAKQDPEPAIDKLFHDVHSGSYDDATIKGCDVDRVEL